MQSVRTCVLLRDLKFMVHPAPVKTDTGPKRYHGKVVHWSCMIGSTPHPSAFQFVWR